MKKCNFVTDHVEWLRKFRKYDEVGKLQEHRPSFIRDTTFS